MERLFAPATLTILGAVLAAIGTIVSALGVYRSSSQRGTFEHELRLKSDEIARLNQEIAASVTGGDSFCYMAISMGDNSQTGMAMLIHQGKYPLYDVGIRVVDLDKFDLLKGEQLTLEKIGEADAFNASIGNLSPSLGQALGKWKVLKNDSARYNIFFNARNGLFTEVLRLRLVEGKWRTAMKVTRRDVADRQVLLKEEIDPRFPRTDKGEVDWK